MNILLVDYGGVNLPGHNVRSVNLPGLGGIVPVRRLLRNDKGIMFRPDVLVQRENLGKRHFLHGLEELDCPKIFFAVDSHLNMAWQHWYARLFDLVLTPHVSLFSALPREWCSPPAQPFAWPGYRRMWRPHAQRGHSSVFVGVIDGHRQQRQKFSELLQQRHGTQVCSLPFSAMLDLYDDTRILPNECIANEFNFRIMEGASCGCCVVTPDIGDDLAVNFTPGSEVLTYRHAQELDELMAVLASRPALGESLGLQAQRRVQACHLPEHRARDLIAACRTLTSHSRPRENGRRAFALACLQWVRGDSSLRSKLPQVTRLLKNLDDHPDVLAMRLRLLTESHRMDEARQLLYQLPPTPLPDALFPPSDLLDAHTACAVTACKLDDFSLFLQYWRLWRPLCPAIKTPSSIFQGCLAWASLLEQCGRISQPGFKFEPDLHCPETSLEMLLMAGRYIADDDDRREWVSRLSRICERKTLSSLSLSFRAQDSLNHPRDWHRGLAYALACLRVYRLEEGLEEAEAARRLAIDAGEEADFANQAKNLALHLPQ